MGEFNSLRSLVDLLRVSREYKPQQEERFEPFRTQECDDWPISGQKVEPEDCDEEPPHLLDSDFAEPTGVIDDDDQKPSVVVVKVEPSGVMENIQQTYPVGVNFMQNPDLHPGQNNFSIRQAFLIDTFSANFWEIRI